jgi:dUTP pyrophosphatase
MKLIGGTGGEIFTNLQVKITKVHPRAVLPTYAKDGDAAMDLHATEIKKDKWGNYVYLTGVAVEIPPGFVGLLFPRSSISRTSMSLANSVGVVDSGYRGEIMLKYRHVNNLNPFYKTGDRVGQLMIMPYPKIEFIEVEELSITDRGDGGFGSTGE